MFFLEKSSCARSAAARLWIGPSAIAYYLVRTHVLKWLHRLRAKTPTKWDEFLFEQGVFNAAALIIPALIMFRVAPFLTVTQEGITQLLKVAVILAVAVAVDRLLRTGLAIYNTFPIAARMPIKGFVQILQIALLGLCRHDHLFPASGAVALDLPERLGRGECCALGGVSRHHPGFSRRPAAHHQRPGAGG